MKLILLIALFLVVSVLGDATTDDIKDRLKKANDKCQEDPKTAVDQEAMKKYLDSKGKEPAPENIGPHALCVSKALKWQHPDGTVNKEYLKERLSLLQKDPVKLEDLMSRCVVNKDTEVETARNLFKCYYHHADEY